MRNSKRKFGIVSLLLAVLILTIAAPVQAKKSARTSSIKLNKKKAVIYTIGKKSIELKAVVKGKSSKVTWKSSNIKIAAVNSKGKVTAKKAGTVTITAKANGKTAKCKIIVKKKRAKAGKRVKVKKSTVYEAYKKYLAQNESKYDYDSMESNSESYKKASGFFVVDMNKDKIPELVTIHPVGWRYQQLYVYTYKNGKVTQVKDSTGNGVIDMSHVANGSIMAYVCNKNHLHIEWGGVNAGNDKPASYKRAYVIKSGKLNLYAEIKDNYMKSNQVEYIINGKNVGKKKYKSATGNCKLTTYAHSNVGSDRSLYLK